MPGLRRFPLPLIAAFFALYVIWGSTYLVIRIGVEYWPPLLLAGIRFVIAGTLMYAFLRWRGAPAPTWAQWKAAGIIGILLLSLRQRRGQRGGTHGRRLRRRGIGGGDGAAVYLALRIFLGRA